MAMPNNLVIVRHGHSEGNLVSDKSKDGDDSFYTPDFRERPGHRWRLTKEGITQAEKAGGWILEKIPQNFDRYYVSPYIRTLETAALLGISDAEWRVDQRLRERDWGDIGSIPKTEFQLSYERSALMKKTDALYWRPPGGESIADVRLRVRNLLDTLHRECAGQSVLLVTHGEFMWAARAELEYMTDEQWVLSQRDPAQKIYNAQVIHYTRSNPETGKIGKYVGWQKSICPWRENLDAPWLPIARKRFTNEDLLEQVRLVKPIPSLQ